MHITIVIALLLVIGQCVAFVIALFSDYYKLKACGLTAKTQAYIPHTWFTWW